MTTDEPARISAPPVEDLSKITTPTDGHPSPVGNTPAGLFLYRCPKCGLEWPIPQDMTGLALYIARKCPRCDPLPARLNRARLSGRVPVASPCRPGGSEQGNPASTPSVSSDNPQIPANVPLPRNARLPRGTCCRQDSG